MGFEENDPISMETAWAWLCDAQQIDKIPFKNADWPGRYRRLFAVAERQTVEISKLEEEILDCGSEYHIKERSE